MNRIPRPLMPIVHFDMPDEETMVEVKGSILKTWNLPSAQLVNLPPNYIQEFYSIDFARFADNESMNDFLTADEVAYSLISAIKYHTSEDRWIYLTTCLLSNKAAELEYVARGDKIILKDGRKATIYKLFNFEKVPLQVTYLTNDIDGKKYQITVGTDLKVVEDTRFSENGCFNVSYQNRDGVTENFIVEGDRFDREMLPSEPLDNSIVLAVKSDPPVYMFDGESELFMEKFLEIVVNNVEFS
jgi:hypothetical protein